MARGYSYYRYRRRRPRRYVRRWFKRRFRRYVNGSSKSVIRMKTSVDKVINLNSGSSSGPGEVNATNAFAGFNTNLGGNSVLSSPLYRTYCNLYEEVKLIGMRVSIAVTSVVGNATLPSLQIFTAWDRRHGVAEAAYTAAEIKAASSYNVATALNNNVAKLTRSIYASDLMEKAQWHDCSINITPPAQAGDPTVYTDAAYAGAGFNPNFFSPCFFLCFQSPTLAPANATTVTASVTVTYYMAFRNPKYGAGASAAAMKSLGGVPLPDADGDMDDDGDLDGPGPDEAVPAARSVEASLDPPPKPMSGRMAAREAHRAMIRAKQAREAAETAPAPKAPRLPVVVIPPNV